MACVVFELSHGVSEAMLLRRSQIIISGNLWPMYSSRMTKFMNIPLGPIQIYEIRRGGSNDYVLYNIKSFSLLVMFDYRVGA